MTGKITAEWFDKIINTHSLNINLTNKIDSIFGTKSELCARDEDNILYLGMSSAYAGNVSNLSLRPVTYLYVAALHQLGHKCYAALSQLPPVIRSKAESELPGIKPIGKEALACSDIVIVDLEAVGSPEFSDTLALARETTQNRKMTFIISGISSVGVESLLQEHFNSPVFLFDSHHSVAVESSFSVLLSFIDAYASRPGIGPADHYFGQYTVADVDKFAEAINAFRVKAGFPALSMPQDGGIAEERAAVILELLRSTKDMAFCVPILDLPLRDKSAAAQLCTLYVELTNFGRTLPNKTLRLIFSPHSGVQPKGFLSDGYYENYYRMRGREPLPSAPPMGTKFCFYYNSGNIDAGVRITSAAAYIESLLNTLRDKVQGRPIRWLDIGCGGGCIMNSVNPNKYLIDNYEFYGVDLSDGDIEWAKRSAEPNRTFIHGNAFSLPQDILQGGFDIVSAFEFLEHIADPISFLEQAKTLARTYVVGESPSNECVSRVEHSRIHMWSFDRDGFTKLFTEAGLHPFMVSETLIGKYCGGQDWLTCVATKEMP